ncbi:MAG: 30S ribosomal protein S27ae [Candidatus Aenigmarchaeota archaeon ex4484_52]|nr:MAG: 30S ribosomal protein S27ae [Candidatus Aenigmarchaeota archaeon ex4484_52]
MLTKKKKSKSKHKKTQIFKKYEIIEGKIKRNFKQCPKCRNILAKRNNRYYCGYCKYTEILNNKNNLCQTVN